MRTTSVLPRRRPCRLASPDTDGYSSFMLVTSMLSSLAFSFPLLFRASTVLSHLVRPLKMALGGSTAAAYTILVPVSTVVIMAAFELPHLPLAYAHGWGFFAEEEHVPATPQGSVAFLSQTQLRVLKLQLYLFALIAGGRVRM